jgi:hypothetical protein
MNKHLIFIIQEYVKKEYSFLNELQKETELLKRDSDCFYTYENYCICVMTNGFMLGSYCYSNKSHEPNGRWRSMTKEYHSAWFK